MSSWPWEWIRFKTNKAIKKTKKKSHHAIVYSALSLALLISMKSDICVLLTCTILTHKSRKNTFQRIAEPFRLVLDVVLAIDWLTFDYDGVSSVKRGVRLLFVFMYKWNKLNMVHICSYFLFFRKFISFEFNSNDFQAIQFFLKYSNGNSMYWIKLTIIYKSIQE